VSQRTEEENIEAFKTWWKENGLKVVAGIVLLVGGYISWDLYEGKIKSEAEAASEIWQSITDSLSEETGNKTTQENQATIQKNAELLKKDFPDTSYAHFAAALKAKLAVENNEVDQAITELTWSLDNDVDDSMRPILNLRLARLVATKGDYEESLEVLRNTDPGSLKAAYEEAKGDIYMILDRKEEAYTAYNSAILFNKSSDQLINNVLQLKLSQVNPPEITVDQVDEVNDIESETEIESL
jgi:predicted negative regulator of RcsB-dependent stress response